MKVRRPSAWGFHPFNSNEEEKEVASSFLSNHGAGKKVTLSEKLTRRVVGGVVPHAGYIYSGPIASHVYYQLAEDGQPDTFVILGPNHRGYPGFCAMLEGIWKMPLGDVYVDAELSRAIVEHSQFVDVNPEAHDQEHSIEVQLPFLQYIYKSNFKIVPITVGQHVDYVMCSDVGIAIGKAIKEKKKDAVILGSTDFTHYGTTYGYAPVGMEPFEKVLKWVYNVDYSLIDKIITLNAKDLVTTVIEKGYTMCGSTSVATMLIAAKEMGAKEGKLLKYATSYDVQGSRDVIVGYGAIIITK